MLTNWLYQRGSDKVVRREGKMYLYRIYLLKLFGFRVFRHRFFMDDPDPLHDHPWPWGRIILRGWYREHYHDGTSADFGPGHIVWRRSAQVLHRVELLTPIVDTLFWHWKRRRVWGFMHKDGWQPTPDEGMDGRPLKGFIFPRKIGEEPAEVVHQ